MKTTTLVLAIISALLTSTMVLAGSDADERSRYYDRRGPLPFKVMDLNGDGAITIDELTKVRGERMSYRARQGYPMRNAGNAPSFQEIDTDGNGSISPAEMSRCPGMGRGMGRGQGQGWNR